MLIVVLYCLSSVAYAEPGSKSPPDPPTPVAVADLEFTAVLAYAKQQYFQGRLDVSLTLLEMLDNRLDLGEDPGEAARAETLIYLGELRLQRSDPQGARDAFRSLLRRTPDASISAYHHPADVVNVFELVRNEVQRERERSSLDEPPLSRTRSRRLPAHTFAPLGIPQFAQRHPVRGLGFGVLQAAAGAASIGSMLHLDAVSVEEEGHPRGWTSEFRDRRIQQIRHQLQWPSTFAFYGLWAWSIGDAMAFHRKQPIRVGVGRIGRTAPGVVLSGPL